MKVYLIVTGLLGGERAARLAKRFKRSFGAIASNAAAAFNHRGDRALQRARWDEPLSSGQRARLEAAVALRLFNPASRCRPAEHGE
jgi:hypothetical protein